MHQHGAKIAAQLQQAGKIATMDVIQGIRPVTASETPAANANAAVDLNLDEIMRMATRFSKMPPNFMTRAMTLEEIPAMVAQFAKAAERAKKSGFDGVEIHAAHGYLISSFLSRASNQRTDQYGGDLKNRARFLLEIIQAAREKVGKDYPVWCRIDGREWGMEERHHSGREPGSGGHAAGRGGGCHPRQRIRLRPRHLHRCPDLLPARKPRARCRERQEGRQDTGDSGGPDRPRTRGGRSCARARPTSSPWAAPFWPILICPTSWRRGRGTTSDRASAATSAPAST